MNETKSNKFNQYFAAANTSGGFISYFDQVFPSDKFNRVYVFKGGPGTGKSSLMKRIASALKEKKCHIEEIFCSSDPHSLDGIIAIKNDKRIAIIDGTSPHERDAAIPGAIDEIINLGDGLDKRWLSANKDKILDIGKEKAKAYKNAYFHLKIAGECDRFIYDDYKSVFDKNKAKNKAEEIFSDFSLSESSVASTKLISSFGRFGPYSLEIKKANFNRNIDIGGDEYSASIFIDSLVEFLFSKGIPFTRFPIPLNPQLTEGIYIQDSDYLIVKSINPDINADEFILPDNVHLERTKRAKEIKETSLLEAQRWFSIASEMHFRLEEIYGHAMNFSKNDEIYDIKLKEITNILEL